MYKCAVCDKECYFHRWYSSDDNGKVKSNAIDTPTYYLHVDDKFIPFCSCKCSNEYYTQNIKDNSNLVVDTGKYKTIDV